VAASLMGIFSALAVLVIISTLMIQFTKEME
jgi:hypothetical protein